MEGAQGVSGVGHSSPIRFLTSAMMASARGSINSRGPKAARGPGGGDAANIEARQNAQQPAWATLVNPFVGAVGIMLGARIKGGE